MRGIVMLDVSMGKDRVRVWPKKRGKAKTPEAKKLQDDFRQASWATKYWDPRNIVSVDQMRKGTPVLIRDLQIMMMYNRFAHFALSDGRQVYSVQARQDVSNSLDSISPLPGSLLMRTQDGWRYIAPPDDDGLAIVSQPDGLAAWQALIIPSGNPWYWHPPVSGDFPSLRSGDATMVTLSDDADLGLVVSNGLMRSGVIQRCALKVLPSSGAFNWWVEAHIVPSITPFSFNAGGLIAYENSSQHLMFHGPYLNGAMQIGMQKLTLGGFLGNTQFAGQSGNAPQFLRLEWNEATKELTGRVSGDGKHWMWYGSAVIGELFTTRPTEVGMGFVNNNSGQGDHPVIVCDRWEQSW